MAQTERAINRQTGFSSTQRHVIASLYRQQSLTASQLADQLSISRGAATQLIDGLVKQGVVERVNDSADRRMVRIKLTDSHQANKAEFQAIIAAAVREFFSDLSDEELLDYVRLMDKVAASKGPGSASDSQPSSGLERS